MGQQRGPRPGHPARRQAPARGGAGHRRSREGGVPRSRPRARHQRRLPRVGWGRRAQRHRLRRRGLGRCLRALRRRHQRQAEPSADDHGRPLPAPRTGGRAGDGEPHHPAPRLVRPGRLRRPRALHASGDRGRQRRARQPHLRPRRAPGRPGRGQRGRRRRARAAAAASRRRRRAGDRLRAAGQPRPRDGRAPLDRRRAGLPRRQGEGGGHRLRRTNPGRPGTRSPTRRAPW